MATFLQWPNEVGTATEQVQLSDFFYSLEAPGQVLNEIPYTGSTYAVERAPQRFVGRFTLDFDDVEAFREVSGWVIQMQISAQPFELLIPNPSPVITYKNDWTDTAEPEKEIPETDFAAMRFSRAGLIDSDGFGEYGQVQMQPANTDQKQYRIRQGALFNFGNRVFKTVRTGGVFAAGTRLRLRYLPKIQFPLVPTLNVKAAADPVGRAWYPLRILTQNRIVAEDGVRFLARLRNGFRPQMGYDPSFPQPIVLEWEEAI